MTPARSIYLDHQATTPCDPLVVEAMLSWLSGRPGNPHSSHHNFGRAAQAAVEAARAEVAALIGAEPDEVFFTSGATEATNIALRGALAGGKKRHAVTSAIEHGCVRETLADMQSGGLRVTEVPVDAEGIVDVRTFEAAVGQRPGLATIMAANNEVGTLQPIAELGRICRDAGVPFHTDAAQAAGKIDLDVVSMNVDLMSISGHKVYGPQGIGALYCRKGLFGKLKPVMTGGGQERGVRPGTVPVALCVGLGKACSVARKEMEIDRKRSLRHRALMLDALADRVDGFQVNGSLQERLPGNLNIWFEGVDAEALLSRMPDVAMSQGSACASDAIEPSHVLLAMGLSPEQAESSVRIGFGRGTTDADVLDAVERIAKEIAGLRLAGSGVSVHRGPARKRVAR